MSLCYTNFLYYQNGYMNQTCWERWNGTQPICDVTFDHVITSHFKTIISQLSRRLQWPGWKYIEWNGAIPACHPNDRVLFLYIMWSNHGKVIKATALKLALTKGTHPHKMNTLTLQLLQKLSGNKFYSKRNQIKCIYFLGSETYPELN